VEQRISAIKAQEKRGNRRSIFVNGEFALGVDETVIADLGLHVGQEISVDQLQEIVHAELIAKAKDRALTLLDYRPRSRAEITRRLKQAGYSEDVIQAVTARLEGLGLIDDAQFSQSWVNHRVISVKPMGKRRIMWELRQKGVANDVAEKALSSIDDDAEYKAALESATRRWEKDSNPDLSAKRRKLIGYLQRQGFGWDTINRAVSGLTPDTEPDMDS
jgi:regulatory protein